MYYYYPCENESTLTTVTSIPFPFDEKDYYTMTAVSPYVEHTHIRYFNCKRCGAVGQQGVCEYCGSAEEREPNDNT